MVILKLWSEKMIILETLVPLNMLDSSLWPSMIMKHLIVMAWIICWSVHNPRSWSCMCWWDVSLVARIAWMVLMALVALMVMVALMALVAWMASVVLVPSVLVLTRRLPRSRMSRIIPTIWMKSNVVLMVVLTTMVRV